VSYYSKPLSADVGSIQIICRIRLTENVKWINKWVLIEIINTNRNKEKVMHSLFLACTSWLENVCYLAIVIFVCQLWPKYDFNADLYLLQRKIWRDKFGRFKSSLELMLCVIDISTLNKTYLIWFDLIWFDKKNINMTMNGGQIRFYLRIYCRTLGILWYMYK
jgi:hypothetical protein